MTEDTTDDGPREDEDRVAASVVYGPTTGLGAEFGPPLTDEEVFEEVGGDYKAKLESLESLRLQQELYLRRARSQNVFIGVAVFLAFIAFFYRSKLAFLSWLPFMDLTVIVGRCAYTIERSLAPLPTLAWLLSVGAGLLAMRRPGAARNMAAAAVTVASVATGIYGATWVFDMARGRSPIPERCPPVREGSAHGAIIAYGQYQRASVSLLIALAALLFVSQIGADGTHRSQRAPRSWRLLAPGCFLVAAVMCGLVLYTPWTKLQSIQGRVGPGVEAPAQLALAGLLLISLAAVLPYDRPHRLGTVAAESLVAVSFAQWAFFKEEAAEHVRTVLRGDTIQTTSALTHREQDNIAAFTGLYSRLFIVGILLLLLGGLCSRLLRQREPRAQRQRTLFGRRAVD